MRVNLEDVKGVGASAARKFREAGVDTVEDLAELDLRGTSVSRLSSQNVAQLRDRAQRLLRAVETGDLTLVEGLGPVAARKLKAAGVETIEDLVDLDLRAQDVEGLSTENIQRLKRNATYLLPER